MNPILNRWKIYFRDPNNKVLQWTTTGVSFGFSFPLIATLVSCPNWQAIVLAHHTNHLLWIIDSAPVILGLTFHAIGRMHKEILLHQLHLENTISERTKNIQVKQAQLEEAQRLAKTGSWSIDFLTGEMTWSKQMFQLFPEEIINGSPDLDRHFSAIHPDDQNSWLLGIDQAIAKGTQYTIRYRTAHLANPIWIEETGQGTFTQGRSRPICLIGTCQDITERVRSEERAKGAQKMKGLIQNIDQIIARSSTMTELIENAVSGIVELEDWCVAAVWLLGPDPHVLVLSKAACSPDDSLVDYVRSMDSRGFLMNNRLIHQALQTRHAMVSKNFEKDEQDLLTELIAIPILMGDSPEGVIEIFSNVEIEVSQLLDAELESIGRRFGSAFSKFAMEAAIRNEQFKFKQLMDGLNASASVSIMGMDGRISFVNATFCGTAGYSKEELIGETYGILSSEHHPESFFTGLWNSIKAGEMWNGEIRHRNKNGSLYWVDTTIVQSQDSEGVPQYLSIGFDVTTRKQAESSLVQSSKLASLGEMSAGIAHEINNPLTIIMGQASLLIRNSSEPEKLAERAESINKAGARISKIVSGLRKFSRSTEKPVFTPHSLGKIIRESLVLTNAKSERETTPVYFESTCDPIIDCDEVEIEQVLVNLISNAIDAVKTLNDKWVKISIEEKDTSVFLRVTDSGTGIPERIKEKLFTPFFTTKKVGDGTGLGLSITRGILADHNASIQINPESPNTCFEVQFYRSGKPLVA